MLDRLRYLGDDKKYVPERGIEPQTLRPDTHALPRNFFIIKIPTPSPSRGRNKGSGGDVQNHAFLAFSKSSLNFAYLKSRVFMKVNA
jgi:hypothetical protein